MTPTNEAGHGLPELPATEFCADHEGTERLYTADQVQQYAIDYAAALALSRGVREGWMRDVADAAASMDKRGDRQMAARLMRLHKDMLAAAPAAAGAQGEGQQVQDQSQQRGDDVAPGDGHAWGDFSRKDLCELADRLTEDANLRITRKWPFLKSPGAIANAIDSATQHYPLVGAIRNVLIETDQIYIVPAATPQPAATDGGVRDRAVKLLSKAFKDAGMPFNAADCERGEVSPTYVPALRAIEAALSSHRQAGDESLNATATQPSAEDIRDAAAAFLEAADARDNEETSTQYPEHERRLRQYKAARTDLESLLALVEKGAGNGR